MKLLQEKFKVTAEEYDAKKKFYTTKYVRNDFITVPFTAKWEIRLIEVMTRSNHWLCKKILRYSMYNKTLSFYTFSRAKILIEYSVGASYMRIAFPKSLGAFKYHIAKELFLLDDSYKRMFKTLNIDNGDVAKVVDLYAKWIIHLDTDPQLTFPRYVRANV